MNAFSGYDTPCEDSKISDLPDHLQYLRDIEFKPLQFLIDGIIPLQCFCAIVGPSYSFKTFIALDMALSVASGIPYQGYDVKQGSVIYVNGEGRHGIGTRINAWCQNNSININDLPFILSDRPVNLRDGDEVIALKQINESVSDVRLIIIDTLNRNSGGMNENAPADMTQFVNACSDLSHHFRCSVIVIHHAGHGNVSRARGHSSFYGALDTEISVKKLSDHNVQIFCTKQKDGEEFEAMQFIAKSFLESIILDKIELRKDKAKVSLKPDEQLALDCLRDLVSANLATNCDVASTKVHLSQWRNEFKRRHIGDNEKTKNTAHQRARKALATWGLVQVDNNFYSLCDKATFGDKSKTVAQHELSSGDTTDTCL